MCLSHYVLVAGKVVSSGPGYVVVVEGGDWAEKVQFVMNKVEWVRSRLRELGYKESSKHMNLFYEPVEGAVLFIDTRQDDINRYGKMHPTMWMWKADKLEQWAINRILDEEYAFLKSKGVKAEFPFWDIFQDGNCKVCGSDFKAPGLICQTCADKVYRCGYCNAPVDRRAIVQKFDYPHFNEMDVIEQFSSHFWEFCATDHSEQEAARRAAEWEQEKERLKLELGKRLKDYPFCKVCGRKIIPFMEMGTAKMVGLDVTYEVRHHLSYADDETIGICQSCHSKIHHSDDPHLSKLKPVDKRPVKPPKYECKLPENGNCPRKGIEDWDLHHVKANKKCIGRCLFIQVNDNGQQSVKKTD